MAKKQQEAIEAIDPLVGKLVWLYEHTPNGGRYEHIARIERTFPDGKAELSFQRRGESSRERVVAPKARPGHVGSAWVSP